MRSTQFVTKTWNPELVTMSEVVAIPIKLLPLHRISQISEVWKSMTNVHEYLDPTSYEALLHEIEPYIVDLG